MELKSVFTDDEAVSPVIGVILMVAITVILAAVIGTFVLGLGDQVQSTSPQASMNFDYNNASGTPGDVLTVTHDGGDSIPAARLNASISGANIKSDTSADSTDNPDTARSGVRWVGDLFGSSGDVAAGNSDDIEGTDGGTVLFKYDVSGTETNFGAAAEGDHLDLSESEVRIIWSSESGDNSATLGTWSGPEA